MKLLATLLILLLASFPGQSAPPAEYKRVEVLSVYDGDTFTARVDLGFKLQITIPCRVAGVDTPELPTAAGKVARDAVRGLILGQTVWLTVHGQEKYGRWLTDVTLPGTPPIDLTKWLIARDLGKPYHGGKR